MNNWEKLWKEDVARRTAYTEYALEVYKARIALYAAEVDKFRLQAEEGGITSDHPLVKAMAAFPPVEIPDIAPPPLPALPIPPNITLPT